MLQLHFRWRSHYLDNSKDKKTVLWQGNRAMQYVFPTPNDSLIVTPTYFSLRKERSIGRR